MRRNKIREYVDRFGFEDDADEELWATRDYFWALKVCLPDGHSAPMWSSFHAGYTCQRSGSQPDYGPPAHPERRAA
jgi:hypothetical protein